MVASTDTNQPRVLHTFTCKCNDRTCLMPGDGRLGAEAGAEWIQVMTLRPQSLLRSLLQLQGDDLTTAVPIEISTAAVSWCVWIQGREGRSYYDEVTTTTAAWLPKHWLPCASPTASPTLTHNTAHAHIQHTLTRRHTRHTQCANTHTFYGYPGSGVVLPPLRCSSAVFLSPISRWRSPTPETTRRRVGQTPLIILMPPLPPSLHLYPGASIEMKTGEYTAVYTRGCRPNEKTSRRRL